MDINLAAGVALPGEALVTKLLDFALTTRSTMDPETRAKWDAAAYQAYRDWNNFWVDNLKWPGTKLP